MLTTVRAKVKHAADDIIEWIQGEMASRAIGISYLMPTCDILCSCKRYVQ